MINLFLENHLNLAWKFSSTIPGYTCFQGNWDLDGLSHSLCICAYIYFHGAVEIENPKNEDVFKVNCQRLKPFLELKDKNIKDILLKDPIYQG